MILIKNRWFFSLLLLGGTILASLYFVFLTPEGREFMDVLLTLMKKSGTIQTLYHLTKFVR